MLAQLTHLLPKRSLMPFLPGASTRPALTRLALLAAANPAVADSLLRDPSMQDVSQHWNDLTMAIMGIGSIEPSDVLATSGNAFAAEEREALLAQGAVGDICHRIFRADGTLVRGELDDRIIAIPVENLMRIPRRVGVAGGERKLEAIHGALAGSWVTTLVTDLRSAEALADRS